MGVMKEVSNGKLYFIQEKHSWGELTEIVFQVSPGGIIFIQKPLSKLKDYFKERDFELFPFMFREFYIYRRRGNSAA